MSDSSDTKRNGINADRETYKIDFVPEYFTLSWSKVKTDKMWNKIKWHRRPSNEMWDRANGDIELGIPGISVLLFCIFTFPTIHVCLINETLLCVTHSLTYFLLHCSVAVCYTLCFFFIQYVFSSICLLPRKIIDQNTDLKQVMSILMLSLGYPRGHALFSLF